MKKQAFFCEIVKKEEKAPSIYAITVKNSLLAQSAKAGQFIHIKCGNEFTLRRPISICDAYMDKLTFIFEIRGEGTQWLAERTQGEMLDILGPLGRGYTTDKIEKALVVGGGIGIYPLLLTAKNVALCHGVLGFRNKDYVVLEEEFKAVCPTLEITTDDGSYGEKGLVTAPMKRLLENNQYDMIYACGPLRMIQAIVALAKEFDVPCEVSMEQRMGCGIGACLVCACKTTSAMKDVEWRYSHVCKEGPVYKGNEVIFDD